MFLLVIRVASLRPQRGFLAQFGAFLCRGVPGGCSRRFPVGWFLRVGRIQWNRFRVTLRFRQ